MDYVATLPLQVQIIAVFLAVLLLLFLGLYVTPALAFRIKIGRLLARLKTIKEKKDSDRYDIPTPEGIVQVLITPPVKTVLQQIKRMPGRRVAGSRAEAFVANPFAALGEDASVVIDPEQFEHADMASRVKWANFLLPCRARRGDAQVVLDGQRGGAVCDDGRSS